jgi:hypothetical protein
VHSTEVGHAIVALRIRPARTRRHSRRRLLHSEAEEAFVCGGIGTSGRLRCPTITNEDGVCVT